MKPYLIFLLFAYHTSASQSLDKTKEVIDSIVKDINSNPSLTIKHFKIPIITYAVQYKTFDYFLKDQQIVKIVTQQKVNNELQVQVFYSKNNELIFSTDHITSYSSINDNIDSSVWAGFFYFKNRVLLDFETRGHGKSELDSWNPQKEILKSYINAKLYIDRSSTRKKKACG